MSTVVVTGANRGLGLELARVYAERGDMVIAACRNPDRATELAALTDHVHAVDMGDHSAIEGLIEAIGDQPVDIVINNAGIDARNLGATDADRDVLVQPPEHLLGQVEVNAVGPWLLSRRLLPQLRRSPAPRIVNITSQIGSMEVSQRIGRDVGYAVSKAALNMITVKLASRLRDEGVIAILVHPGHLRTSMGGSAAAMEPGDSARRIVNLVDGLTIADTGRFLRWDGTEHPW